MTIQLTVVQAKSNRVCLLDGCLVFARQLIARKRLIPDGRQRLQTHARAKASTYHHIRCKLESPSTLHGTLR
jgi:hypothetical protein